MSGQDNTDNYTEDARNNNYRHHPNEGTELVGLGAADTTTLFASASDASLTAEAKTTLNAATAANGSPSSPIAQVNVPPSSSTSSATANSSSPLSQQQQQQNIQQHQRQHQQQQQQPPLTSPNLKAMSPQPHQAPPLTQYGSSASSAGGNTLAGGGSSGVSDLKLRRFLEHNQRLREQLEMRRIPVSEAGRGLIQYVTNTRDGLLPTVWGPPDPDPFVNPSKGCCTIS
ncbi:guanine nucleotide-binding protein subunit gamma, other [Entomortierella parvispora]|uniref:Guanine nucleotide-binding protein subunit gamma n=1 Tax=Entomortierella parvispora TaxID=205924 RepID=A0A9P3HDI5_9FUNG|nr:guanine nucleotide-binding protein subunit gamma, other [Entomortierella parvispora]